MAAANYIFIFEFHLPLLKFPCIFRYFFVNLQQIDVIISNENFHNHIWLCLANIGAVSYY